MNIDDLNAAEATQVAKDRVLQSHRRSLMRHTVTRTAQVEVNWAGDLYAGGIVIIEVC